MLAIEAGLARLYLAVALAEECPLVTADEKLGQQLRATAPQQTILDLAGLHKRRHTP